MLSQPNFQAHSEFQKKKERQKNPHGADCQVDQQTHGIKKPPSEWHLLKPQSLYTNLTLTPSADQPLSIDD